MRAGVAKVELFLAIAQNFAQSRVVEQQPTILIDHQQRRGAELQHLAELALVLGSLDSRSRSRHWSPPICLLSCQKTCGPRRTDLANASTQVRGVRGAYSAGGAKSEVQGRCCLRVMSGRDIVKVTLR